MLLRSLLVCCIVLPGARSFSQPALPTKTSTSTALASSTKPAEAALERTASHLKKLKLQESDASRGSTNADINADALTAEYLQQPANALKVQLKKLKLPTKGKKPDLARRLAEYETGVATGANYNKDIKEWNPEEEGEKVEKVGKGDTPASSEPINTFCGLKLSKAASEALGKANFRAPSPIQQAAIPAQVNGESIIMHAQTGSGKTLAYLLPITEQLWKEHDAQNDEGYGFILTPTRELAAQVAGT